LVESYHEILEHKILGRTCPWGQDDITERSATLPRAQIESIPVLQKLGEIEPLGRELFDVVKVVQAIVPRLPNRMEEPVGVVKLAALHVERVRREGLESNEVEQDHADIRIVGAIPTDKRRRLESPHTQKHEIFEQELT
jgi:hypothetical protein